MRHISFSMTTPQFRARTKDVTRRMGWLKLRAGDELLAVEKAMGLKKGQQVVPLGRIRVVSVGPEPLSRLTLHPGYGRSEVDREGFPNMTPGEFIDFFCQGHAGCTPSSMLTRIEFEYL